jgi:predicted DNA-binding transcriptional regulator YafY
LSPQESLLLTLAEKQLRSLMPDSVMKALDGFFSQARANLSPGSHAAREREWLSKIRVVSETQPLLPPKIRTGVLEAVSNSLYRNQYLSLSYKNASGKTTTADVMPLGLAQQGPRLYLVCRFPGHDNERSLALHRILSALASTLTFEPPKEFDLRRYDDDGRFGFGEGNRIKLSFQIAKNTGLHLVESPLSTDQKVKELDDDFEITATVVDTFQLKRWLRGFGDKVKNIKTTAILNPSK